MKKLGYIWIAVRKNLLPMIGALVIIGSALITASIKSEMIILTITALIVYWYTLETRKMRMQIAGENEIKVMPVLLLKLNKEERNFSLENFGQFPALNIDFGSIRVHVWTKEEDTKQEGNGNLESLTQHKIFEMLLTPVDSLIPNERKTVDVYQIVCAEPSTSKDIFEGEEIASFLEDCFYPQIEYESQKILVSFQNVLGEDYKVELGVGLTGSSVGRASRVKQIRE